MEDEKKVLTEEDVKNYKAITKTLLIRAALIGSCAFLGAKYGTKSAIKKGSLSIDLNVPDPDGSIIRYHSK